MELQYVYLIQEREFVQSGKPIFKIGKTKQPNFARFKQYSKGSIVIHHSTCFNCDECEKEIITFFKLKYKQRTDIGTESFEGDYRVMICDILLISLRLWKQQVEPEKISGPTSQNGCPEASIGIVEFKEESENIDDKIKCNFCCSVCNYSTISKGSWEKHLRSKKHDINVKLIEPLVTNFRCDKCCKYYKGQSGLWGHLNKCKNKSNKIDKFSCSVCNYSTNYKGSWDKHLQSIKHILT
jgi:hypothetical protein